MAPPRAPLHTTRFHFPLLLMSKRGKLSAAVQALASRFRQRINYRDSRDGPSSVGDLRRKARASGTESFSVRRLTRKHGRGMWIGSGAAWGQTRRV
jgi:hypothetical protein